MVSVEPALIQSTAIACCCRDKSVGCWLTSITIRFTTQYSSAEEKATLMTNFLFSRKKYHIRKGRDRRSRL